MNVISTIALAAVLAVLALPATAGASTYCVAPASVGCTKTFPTKEQAVEAADEYPGTDILRTREGASTRVAPLSLATKLPKTSGPSFFDDVTNFMLTWLPLIFM